MLSQLSTTRHNPYSAKSINLSAYTITVALSSFTHLADTWHALPLCSQHRFASTVIGESPQLSRKAVGKTPRPRHRNTAHAKAGKNFASCASVMLRKHMLQLSSRRYHSITAVTPTPSGPPIILKLMLQSLNLGGTQHCLCQGAPSAGDPCRS
jgi:hypothetical protein